MMMFMKPAEPVAAMAALTIVLISGLVHFVARSDFGNRGCSELPPEQWTFTGNCQDAASIMQTTSLVFLGSLAVLGGLVWRVQHA